MKKPTTTPKRKPPEPEIIGQPRALKKVDQLKTSLLGTDRTDHWEIVLGMESEIKKELLKNDLSQHQGMKLLLDWMLVQVRDTNALLTLAKSDQLTSSQRDGLIERRDFITALMKFLDPKGARLSDLERELDYQLEEPDVDMQQNDS